MSAPQNFRSAFNGFNREDVVHYLEYINAKHTAQVNQLTSENEELRSRMEQQPDEDLVASLQETCDDLRAQLQQAQERCAELEAQLSQAQEAAPQQAPVPTVSEELEAYRRAERIEREAKERAELVYYQANGVLTEATAKVDGLSADITDLADKVMAQLTQLQVSVSGSKQALQEAASIMNAIRPNK